MRQKIRNSFLTELYDAYFQGDRSKTYHIPKELQEYILAIKYLEEKGLIKIISKNGMFGAKVFREMPQYMKNRGEWVIYTFQLTLTVEGIDIVEREKLNLADVLSTNRLRCEDLERLLDRENIIRTGEYSSPSEISNSLIQAVEIATQKLEESMMTVQYWIRKASYLSNGQKLTSERSTFRFFNGKYGLMNPQTEQLILEPIYDSIGGFYYNHAITMKGNQTYLINSSGKIVYEAPVGYFIYDFSGIFKNKIYVKTDDSSKEDYITDLQGQTTFFLTKKHYAYYSNASSTNSLMPLDYLDQGVLAVRVKDKYGFINGNGEIVIEPLYDEVSRPRDGLILTSIENRWGIINLEGKIILDNIYQEIISQKDGTFMVRKHGKWGFANSKGVIVKSPTFDAIYPFSDGITAYKIDNLWGFIDRNGNYITDAIFLDVEQDYDFYVSYYSYRKKKYGKNRNEISVVTRYIRSMDDIKEIQERHLLAIKQQQRHPLLKIFDLFKK